MATVGAVSMIALRGDLFFFPEIVRGGVLVDLYAGASAQKNVDAQVSTVRAENTADRKISTRRSDLRP